MVYVRRRALNSYSSLAAVYVRLPVHLLWREALAESTSRGVTYGSTRGVYAVYCYGLTLHVGMCTPRTSDASSELPRSRRSARVRTAHSTQVYGRGSRETARMSPACSALRCANNQLIQFHTVLPVPYTPTPWSLFGRRSRGPRTVHAADDSADGCANSSLAEP